VMESVGVVQAVVSQAASLPSRQEACNKAAKYRRRRVLAASLWMMRPSEAY
jgi:hypothetical protein